MPNARMLAMRFILSWGNLIIYIGSVDKLEERISDIDKKFNDLSVSNVAAKADVDVALKSIQDSCDAVKAQCEADTGQ